jgi:phosphoglycerate dehydrogenase-like enzyme
VQVQFPGSRSYNQVGEAENADDLKDVDAANIVKVSGPRASCAKAMEDLKVIPRNEIHTTHIDVPPETAQADRC